MTTLRTAIFGAALLAATAAQGGAQTPFSFVFVVRHDPAVIKLNDMLISSLLQSKRDNICEAAGIDVAVFQRFTLTNAGEQPPGTYAGQLVLEFRDGTDRTVMRRVAQVHIDLMRIVLDELLMGNQKRSLTDRLKHSRKELVVATEVLKSIHRPRPAPAESIRLDIDRLHLELRELEVQAKSEDAALQVLHAEQARVAKRMAKHEEQREEIRARFAAAEVEIAALPSRNLTERQRHEHATKLAQLDSLRALMETIAAEMEALRAASEEHAARIRAHTVKAPMLRERQNVTQEQLARTMERLQSAEERLDKQQDEALARAELTHRVQRLQDRVAQLEAQLAATQSVHVQPWW